MLSLGLLGKNIAHSRSQEVYEQLLKTKVNYTLFDYPQEEKVPPLSDLFQQIDGLSVTSPYKKLFLKSTEVHDFCPQFRAINCLRKVEEKRFEGTNTDYLAVKKILMNYSNIKKDLDIIILGNGAMANITEITLQEIGLPYRKFFRSTEVSDLNSLEFTFSATYNSQPLIINCCSRDFIFKAALPSDAIFWDHNYSLEHHQKGVSAICNYHDGFELLKLQAYFALEFWHVSDHFSLE